MSILLLVGLLISSTHAFYHVLKDTSGTSSYMLKISTISTDSFDLLIYKQSQYSSSPICSDCILFNDTLQSHNIQFSQDTISFHIHSNTIYIFIQCPILLTISITLPSHNIQYIPYTQTVINNPNHNQFHCVFQQQSDESFNSINYLMYNNNNTAPLSLYQYHFPLTFNQLKYNIPKPFNTSQIPYITYINNTIYFISLSPKLNIASYNFMDQIWLQNDAPLSEIPFNPSLAITYVGIHLTKHTSNPILNIFFHSHNTYEILSWLINTDIYSIHEYTYNPLDSTPIIINDNNIHTILSPTNHIHNFIYYSNINSFLQQISYTTQYMHITYNKRRRLQKSDPECRDQSNTCSLVAHDCDDESIKDYCRETCNQCEEHPFNCSDYKSTTQTADICEYPRRTPSFCNDQGGWFKYYCPITCKHANCSDIWMTLNPTPMPIMTTTVFKSTQITYINVETTDIPSVSPSIYPTNIPTNPELTTETDIKTPIVGKIENNDMSLILILLAVLLICVFMAGILLWICYNIARLQSNRNDVYNAMAAMSNRTPDYYTHNGGAPSTPDYNKYLQRRIHTDPLRG